MMPPHRGTDGTRGLAEPLYIPRTLGGWLALLRQQRRKRGAGARGRAGVAGHRPWSQEDLAEVTGINSTLIRRVEAGLVLPTREQIAALVRELASSRWQRQLLLALWQGHLAPPLEVGSLPLDEVEPVLASAPWPAVLIDPLGYVCRANRFAAPLLGTEEWGDRRLHLLRVLTSEHAGRLLGDQQHELAGRALRWLLCATAPAVGHPEYGAMLAEIEADPFWGNQLPWLLLGDAAPPFCPPLTLEVRGPVRERLALQPLEGPDYLVHQHRVLALVPTSASLSAYLRYAARVEAPADRQDNDL